MAPNKLENQIKEKLNSREIQPSAQAWDRLDAMLTVAEEKKTKRSFGWLYIAAGITILLTVGMFLFTQNGTDIQPQNNVVDTETKKDPLQKEENNRQAPIAEKNQENQAVASSPINNNHQQSVSIINQKTNNQNQISNDKEIKFQNSQDVVQKDVPKTEERKPTTIDRSTVLSDEQLLASLDNSVKKSTNQSSVKVDAKTLLSEVDGEVEYTFREKVINKISKNYKEVKVALANRNNQ